MPKYVRRPGHPLADDMNMVDALLLGFEGSGGSPLCDQ